MKKRWVVYLDGFRFGPSRVRATFMTKNAADRHGRWLVKNYPMRWVDKDGQSWPQHRLEKELVDTSKL